MATPRKPPEPSWWTKAGPEHFTQTAEELWKQRQPDSSMSGVTLANAAKKGVL